MRALRMLMATIGCLFGLLIWTVAALMEMLTAPPVRVAFDTGSVSVAIDPWTFFAIVVVALLGGLSGWMSGLVMTRSGWRLSRQQ